MKVVVYGAKGKSGVEIVKELVSRGHQVVAVTRHADYSAPGATSAVDDASHPDKIAAVVRGADAVVSALAPPMTDTDQIVGLTDRVVEGVSLAGGKNSGPRLLIVGGAGSLYVTGQDGKRVTLRDSGYLPAEWLPIVDSHIKVLDNLKKNQTIDWTYFSPAGFFEVGPRKGTFRLGKDDLIVGENGKSEISYADYAIAVADELEKPQFRGQRFTAAY